MYSRHLFEHPRLVGLRLAAVQEGTNLGHLRSEGAMVRG